MRRVVGVMATGIVMMTLGGAAPTVATGGDAADGCPLDPPVATPQGERRGGRPMTAVRVHALANQVPDMSDTGEGWVTLCLDDGTVREGMASCDWTEDRAEVRYINSARFGFRGGKADAHVSWTLNGPVVTIDGKGRHRFDTRHGGTLEVPFPLPASGVATFADIPGIGGFEGSISGRLGWVCGSPPVQDPGLTPGSVTYALEGPVAGVYRASALCAWEERADGRVVVGSVSAYERRQPVGDGSWVNLTIGLSPDAPEPSISVRLRQEDTNFDAIGEWADVYTALVTERSADDASGTVRVVAFRDDAVADDEPEQFVDPSTFGGTVRWTCEGPPERTTYRYPWDEAPRAPGTVELTFSDAPIRSVSVPASCVAYRDEEDGHVDTGPIVADLVISGRRVRHWNLWADVFVLVVLAQDGTPLGEYIADPQGDELIGGLTSDDNSWRSTSPLTFVAGHSLPPPPLFPGADPASFRARVTTECRVP